MNSNLLIAIRASKKRIDPAIKKQARKRPLREKVMKYLRVLSPLGQIPIFLPRKKRFFLDGGVQVNSKSGDVYRELTAKGIEVESIWVRKSKPRSLLIRIGRILWRTPWLIAFYLTTRKFFQNLDLPGGQIFVGYEAYRGFFRKYPKLITIIISDISPTLHMQWAAALSVGNKVLWWQDDYHHYNGFSSENYFPYRCDFAAVLNQYGYNTVMNRSPDTKIFKRKETEVRPLNEIPSTPRVGMATNATFEGTSEQIDQINRIRKQLEVNDIYFRLHPNSKLHGSTDKPKWMQFAPKDETLATFAEEVDLVVVGNSAVQLKLLCLGIPVIHIGGLDQQDYDTYGYCRLGFSYGSKNIDDLSIQNAREVYGRNHEISSRLRKYVSVLSPTTGLTDLKDSMR